MHCCVRDCDTDENVVNCTSVFFVGFPSDTTLRCDWLNILTAHNAIPEEVTEHTKICSCHFDDESFGKHPVHGYRFLLPTAIPTILPVSQDVSILPDDTNVIVESFDTASIETLSIAPEEPEEPVHLIPATSAVDGLINTPKTIGIEYANGKYYFLQSEDESEEEEEEVPANGEIIQSEGTPLDEGAMIGTQENGEDVQSECKSSVDNVSWLKEESIQLMDEAGMVVPEEATTEIDSIIEEASVITTYWDVGCNSVKEENRDESNACMEMIEEDAIKSEYGTVEMLEDLGTPSVSKDRRVDKHFCQYCGKGFPYGSGLKKHLLVHTGLKPHACETCGKRFSQKINLTIHLRRHTGEEPFKKFVCPLCEKKCIRLSELKNHIKTHWKKTPHACPICTERFADITNYYDHIKSKHKDELTLQESIDLIALNENAEVIVPGDGESLELEQGVCTVCFKIFKTERSLKKHKRKMHPKIFVCPNCPKQFLYKSLLDKHTRVHTQEKPFRCSECEAAFSQKINLDIHLNRKHNFNVGNPIERCFECEYCDKTFDRPSSLKTHTRIHTNERPFACAHCPKSYATNSSLASHIKANHRGESVLLQASARKKIADTDHLIVEERGAPDIVEEVQDADGNVIQYSIQIIDPPNVTLEQ
ncbi:zinc finger protein 69 homolog [Toxorhynchites rutilus septentrionalis]|uniref:zinc finger protein 69 homolog n=1 Tax=Toxorhynchites rutilus septentrionalis TaxID=329112 RepID=UPI002479A3A3|nr:zinc finger protein 69 homolog [Toxorhynchites rutilus septentrionalis]